MLEMAERIRLRGGNVNRILSETYADGVDVHQLNCTYYSALECDDDRYLAARAIQLFAKGVPQIYYVGLLAGENDQAAVERVGEGRAINRHDYTLDEIDAALRRPVVGRLLDLVRLRNTHPAFDGELSVETDTGSTVRLQWKHGDASCTLEVNLASGHAVVNDGGRIRPVLA
jgi:sucrose phosphorylase